MNAEKLIAHIGFVIGILGVGYAIGANDKLKIVSNIVNKSVDSIIADGKVDISNEVIEDVIRAKTMDIIQDRARFKVNEACDEVIRNVKTAMYVKVSDAAEKAVNATYEGMKREAKDQIQKELRNIDISSLKEEVKADAAELVQQKLSSQMDDILESFNTNLMNVQTIYSSIAKAMSEK